MKETPVAWGSLMRNNASKLCGLETGIFAKNRKINAVVALEGQLEFLSLSESLEQNWTHHIPLPAGENPKLARLRPQDCDHDWIIVVCTAKVLALEFDEQVDDFICRSTLKHVGGEVVFKQEGVVLLSGRKSKKTYYVSLSIPPRNSSGEHTIRERFLPMTDARDWNPIHIDEDCIYTASYSNRSTVTRMDWDGVKKYATVATSDHKYVLGNLLLCLNKPIRIYEIDKIFKKPLAGYGALEVKLNSFESILDSASSRNPFEVSRLDELSKLDGMWLRAGGTDGTAVKFQVSDDGTVSCTYYNLYMQSCVPGPELRSIAPGVILFIHSQSLYSQNLVSGKVSELRAYLNYGNQNRNILSDEFGIAVKSPGLTGCSNIWYKTRSVLSEPNSGKLIPLTSPFCPEIYCRKAFSALGVQKIFNVGPSWILATSAKDSYVLEFSKDKNEFFRTGDPWINKQEHTIDANDEIQLTANTINFLKLKKTISLSVPAKIGSVCQDSVAFVDTNRNAWVCSAGDQMCTERVLPEGDMKRECLLYLLALSHQQKSLSFLSSSIHCAGLIQVLRHQDWLVCSYSTGRILIYSCLSKSISFEPLVEYHINHTRVRILSIGGNILCIANGFPRALLVAYSESNSLSKFKTCWLANPSPFRELCSNDCGLYVFAVNEIKVMELRYGDSFSSLANPPRGLDLSDLQNDYKEPITECCGYIDNNRYLQIMKTSSTYQLVLRSQASAGILAHVNLPSKAEFLKCFTDLKLEKCKEFGFVVLVPDVKRFWEYYFPQPIYLYSLPSLKRIREVKLPFLQLDHGVPRQTYVFRQLEYFPIQRLDFALSQNSRLYFTRLRMTYPRTGSIHTLLHWGGTPSIERGNTPPHISQDQTGCWVQLGARVFYTKFSDLTQKPEIVDELPTFKKNEKSHQSCLTTEGIYLHHMSVSETRAWAINNSDLPSLGRSTLPYERPKHAETVTVPDESHTQAMTVIGKGLQAKWKAAAESLGSCFGNITPRAVTIAGEVSTVTCYFTFNNIELFDHLNEVISQLNDAYSRRYGIKCSEGGSLQLDMLMEAGQRHSKLLAELNPSLLTEAHNLQKLFNGVFSRNELSQ